MTAMSVHFFIVGLLLPQFVKTQLDPTPAPDERVEGPSDATPAPDYWLAPDNDPTPAPDEYDPGAADPTPAPDYSIPSPGEPTLAPADPTAIPTWAPAEREYGAEDPTPAPENSTLAPPKHKCDPNFCEGCYYFCGHDPPFDVCAGEGVSRHSCSVNPFCEVCVAVCKKDANGQCPIGCPSGNYDCPTTTSATSGPTRRFL